MNFGSQIATILKAFVGMKPDNGNLFVNLKMELTTGENVYSRIFITEKSMGIARARLKKCGFDVDAQELADIEQNSDLLTGNQVPVDVYEEMYMGKNQTRVEITLDHLKVDKSALTRATKALRNAKKHMDYVDSAASPAVSHIPKDERDALNQKAEEEDIPF